MRLCRCPGRDGGSDDPLANPRFLLTVSRPTSLKSVNPPLCRAPDVRGLELTCHASDVALLRIRLQATSARPVPTSLAVYATDAVGAAKDVAHSTGAYSDAPTGVVTGLFRLEPSSGGYLVIPSTYHAGVHAPFSLVVHADQPVTLTALP